MGEAGKDQRLTAKTFAGKRVAPRAAQEHLDGDDAIQVGIMRLPYLAHTTLADGLDQAVPAQHRARLSHQTAAFVASCRSASAAARSRPIHRLNRIRRSASTLRVPSSLSPSFASNFS